MWEYIIVAFISLTIGAAVGYVTAALMTANNNRKDK